jgi:hypothetical protein
MMAVSDITLNPLSLFNIEVSVQGFVPIEPKVNLYNSNTLLHDISWDDNARTVSAVKKRYKELLEIDSAFRVAPAEKRILTKIISPLRQAKANYVLSNYLSTITLCGMAGEMIAMLLYDMFIELKRNLSPSDHARLRKFKTFQRMGQDRRVAHLSEFDCVGAGVEEPFAALCRIRRDYLHFYLHGFENLKRDAKECYRNAFLLLNSALPHRLHKNRIEFSPHVLEYLKKKGTARED